jgi:hypothetical protein
MKKLMVALALILSQGAFADTGCSVLSKDQADAFTIALDLFLLAGQNLVLQDDNTGKVEAVSNVSTTALSDFRGGILGYSIQAQNKLTGQWHTLDIGHITAINATTGGQIRLSDAANCVP